METLKQQCAIPTLKGALQEKYPLFLSRIPAMVPAALADATLRTNRVRSMARPSRNCWRACNE